MEAKKTSSLNFILIFFLSYSFYTIQILTQELFFLYSKQSIIIICSLFTLFPLITFFICKSINKSKIKNNTKNSFAYSLFSSLYLIITAIISILYISNIILIYYYQQTSIIILLLFLALPIIYIIIKGENNFFSLASILLIIYIIFKYSYIKNYPPIDTYTFYNISKIDKNNIFSIIIISLPILIEPFLLINHKKDMTDKINIKFITIASISLSIISIITILRQTWEFGNLLNIIRFPYLESIKNIVAGKFFENIDYYYLLSLSVSIFTRLGYTILSMKKSYNLNKKISVIILIGILVLVYFLHKNMNFYNLYMSKILFISSICLILLIILFLFTLKKKVKNNV